MCFVLSLWCWSQGKERNWFFKSVWAETGRKGVEEDRGDAGGREMKGKEGKRQMDTMQDICKDHKVLKFNLLQILFCKL